MANIAASEKRLSDELAQHARALQEWMSNHISVVDGKYRDLPGPVQRIGTEVFTPDEPRRAR